MNGCKTFCVIKFNCWGCFEYRLILRYMKEEAKIWILARFGFG